MQRRHGVARMRAKVVRQLLVGVPEVRDMQIARQWVKVLCAGIWDAIFRRKAIFPC